MEDSSLWNEAVASDATSAMFTAEEEDDSIFRVDDESDLVHIDEGKSVTEAEVREADIICKRGAQNTTDTRVQDYLDQTDVYYDRYMGTSNRTEKHQYRNAVIRWVYRRGGRFLKPIDNQVGMYRVMTLSKVKLKVVQNLREERKKYRSSSQPNSPQGRRTCCAPPLVVTNNTLPPTKQTLEETRPNDDIGDVATKEDGRTAARQRQEEEEFGAISLPSIDPLPRDLLNMSDEEWQSVMDRLAW